MFAQLCEDQPWTQKLSEVWRMRDPDERAASLALRDGNAAEVTRAVAWYRTHDRLHCGDAVTMAHDALNAYGAEQAEGLDALLICDTTEVARALNQRVHEQRIGRDDPTLFAAHGQRIGVGDVIISRRNDPTITILDKPDATAPAPMVRNGNRWRVAAIDSEKYRIAAVRLDDGAGAVFSGNYLREHINLGYAVTVHSAQGVTADTSHAVLGEDTTRNLLYVAMTRGRHTNTAHLYERIVDTQDQPEAVHSLVRGNSMEAAQLAMALIARDDPPRSVHEIVSKTDSTAVPERVARLMARHVDAVASRRDGFLAWQSAVTRRSKYPNAARERGVSRNHGVDYSVEV